MAMEKIMTMKVLHLIVLGLVADHIGAGEGPEICSAIVTPDFSHCDNLRHPRHGLGLCSNSSVCNKHFVFTSISIDPFRNLIKDVFSNVIESCCGSCKSLDNYDMRSVHLEENLSHALISTSNFIFPVLGRHSENTVYGYNYIPLLELSSGFYITRASTRKEALTRLIVSCVNLWPLVVIMLLLALIAGFIAWIGDTWSNRKEFHRTFLVGLFDGFWWSFISMATVGYGDKSPKFVFTRLFSVAWILLGIIICAIFTATLTNEVSSASNPSPPDMLGQNVGVLKHRTFDASFVAKHGGIIEETMGKTGDEDIIELKDMLLEGKVNGIFLDKYTYMHALAFSKDITCNRNHSHDEHGEAAEFFLNQTYHTRMSYEGRPMSYGVIVREEEDYKYFQEFIRHNEAVYETCALLKLNEEDSNEVELVHDFFSVDGAYFYPFLYGSVVVVGAIFIVGIMFEVLRRRKKGLSFGDVFPPV